MAVDQRERRRLQEALVRSIGTQAADTLVGYLPPVGWADVATKDDLDVLRTEMGAMESRLRADLTTQLAALQVCLNDKLRAQFYWTVIAMTALLTAFVTVTKLG